MSIDVIDPVLDERKEIPNEESSAATAVNTTNVETSQATPVEEVEIPSALPTEAASESESVPEEAVESAPEEEAQPENESSESEGNASLAEQPVQTDYSTYNRSALVTILQNIIENQEVEAIRHDVEAIKFQFYKRLKQEQEVARKAFVEAGHAEEEFVSAADDEEEKLKQCLNRYKEKKAVISEQLEAEKQKNLEAKYEIIKELKDLVNRNESIGDTFQNFRALQARWRSIGLVPQQEVKNLWDTYHHNVEIFYDYIKINKELRDLDLKKNLEAKMQLCEKAEELLLEPSEIKAFKALQVLHEQWREVGPVSQEMRVEIWERFKTASTKINKKHQQFFEKQKESQQKNLEAKTTLCEKAEELASAPCKSLAEWESRSKELIEVQKVWQTIGFAAKKENLKIYKRFRTACDTFFNNKREYFSQSKEDQINNLQLKEDLCNQAEALKDSTEWKETTEDFIKLQQRWKEIGPVPRKHRDAIWKRFRTACDAFFEKKSTHFDTVESSYGDNYKAKLDLIEKIKAFVPVEDMDENINRLKEFQRLWSEIGFVPIKFKTKVQDLYREAIAAQFDALHLDEAKRNLIRYKSKIENMASASHTRHKVESERDKLFKKLQQLQSDIIVWENNIGFFSKSKKAESMIANVRSMIDKGKEEVKVLEEKIRLIDQMGSES